MSALLRLNTTTPWSDAPEVDDDDIPVLHYSRRHGLSKNIFEELPWPVLQSLPTPRIDELHKQWNIGNDAFIYPTCHLETERLALDEASRILCIEAFNGRVLTPWIDAEVDQSVAERTARRAMKLELPVLRTDNECDLKCFNEKSLLSKFTCPDICWKTAGLNDDHAFDFPSWMRSLPEQMVSKLAAEKATFPQSALHYLFEIVGRHDLDQADKDATEYEARSLLKKRVEPVTPILLHPDPFVALPKVLDKNMSVMFASNNTKLVDDEMTADKHIAEVDRIHTRLNAEASSVSTSQLNNSDGIAKLYSPMEYNSRHLSPSPLPQPRRTELKVEVPLSPLRPLDANRELTYASLGQVLPNDTLRTLKESVQQIGSTPCDLPDFFDEIAPIAKRVDAIVQHEQLIIEDSTLRLDIPTMDFPPPLRPWVLQMGDHLQSGPDAVLKTWTMWMWKSCSNQNGFHSKWKHTSVPEISLVWCPVLTGASFNIVDESINDQNYLGRIYDDMLKVSAVVSGTLVWKPGGLRVLDDLEDNDEIDVGTFEIDQQTIEFIARNQAEAVQRSRKSEKRSLESETSLLPTQLSSRPAALHGENPVDHGFFGNDLFSASTRLGHFFALAGDRQVKKRKLNDAPTRDRGTIALQSTAGEGKRTTQPGLVENMYHPIVLPSLPLSLPARYFIVSATVLQSQRSLLRQMEQNYPAAILVERDFSTLCSRSTFTIAPLKQQTSPHFDPTAEADIIVSPSTGLMLTNLQKIVQQTLPGEGPVRNTFCDRLKQVAVRYERIIILVSQGIQDYSKGSERTRYGTHRSIIRGSDLKSTPDASVSIFQEVGNGQAEAIARLQGVGLVTETSVHIQFVPGGERELAHFAVVCMDAFCNVRMSIAQVDSTWEHVLRRAGFNAFAALAILDTLRQQDEIPPDGTEVYSDTRREDYTNNHINGLGDIQGLEEREGCSAGKSTLSSDRKFSGLRAFLHMLPEERVTMFEGILDGRRVLDRVNTCLERTWISAGRGFGDGQVTR